jgi:signal transduction histidine kinase
MSGEGQASLMTADYQPLLVVTSVAIAILASYVALDMAARLSGPRRPARRWWWLCAPIAMGVGIWSMHFVGMLAFHLPVPVGYDGALVLLSVFVAVAASALALFVASRPSLPLPVLAFASLCMGGAIVGMHYIGMAAMRLPAVITWRPVLVGLSIVIAIGASFAALLMAFRLRRTASSMFHWSKLGAATVMGIAISGMHYTGMAAAQFATAAPGIPHEGLSLHSSGMAIGVVAGTFVVLSMALAGAAFDERARLLALEQHARGQAEAANRLKDEFLATLSHELRTPLNVILGRAGMLRAHAADPTLVVHTADTITRNAEALKHVVEDLLDVSRMTLGGMHLDFQRVDMADLLRAAADSLRAGANAKGIRLTVRSSRGLPRVLGDPARLQQVIWNLLTNAVKFTPPGGHVHAALRRDGAHVLLAVTDTGRGIDPGFLPHVFEMFRQAEATTNRTEGGLGIGLSIVRRLVELHGGTVSAESTGVGHGATFIVRLPHQAAETAAAPEPQSVPLVADGSEQ